MRSPQPQPATCARTHTMYQQHPVMKPPYNPTQQRNGLCTNGTEPQTAPHAQPSSQMPQMLYPPILPAEASPAFAPPQLFSRNMGVLQRSATVASPGLSPSAAARPRTI